MITLSKKFYWGVGVIVCDLETSTMRRAGPDWVFAPKKKKGVVKYFSFFQDRYV
jgi:hypothetical protein